MNLNEYKELHETSNGYLDSLKLEVSVVGLAEEAGEFAGLYKRVIRDNNGYVGADLREKMALELGDILWYLLLACDATGYEIEDVMKMNVEKLKLRGYLK